MVGEPVAGHGVDEHGVDVGDGGRVVGVGEDDRRHRRRQRGEGLVDDGVGQRLPAGDEQVALGPHDRRDVAG